MSQFSILTLHSVDEIDPADWEQFSPGQPFQSHRWYRFGEKVMADCPPVYFLLRLEGRPIARAAFWLIKNEPLPLPAGLPRQFFQRLLQRWPLLVCRSPLSNASGLVLPEEPALRQAALTEIAQLACQELTRKNGSFLLFDYLTAAEMDQAGWPSDFTGLSIADPGTILLNRWDNFEAYLANGGKKDRQHYKRAMRAAQSSGSRLLQNASIIDLDEALALIRQVENRHGSPPNPWAKGLLVHRGLVDGCFLEARIGERLVGCGLLLEDGETQLTTALGLAPEVPNVYFQLIYASLQQALEHHLTNLRWGSGAYEVKKQLGFELELNNYVMIFGRSRWLNLLLSLVKYASLQS